MNIWVVPGFLAVTNKAAMNTHVRIFHERQLSRLLGEIAGLFSRSMLNFLRDY